jgi:hypothetical protein
MIAVIGLPGGIQRLQGIEGARVRRDRSADGEAALLLDCQRLGPVRLLGIDSGRRDNAGG